MNQYSILSLVLPTVRRIRHEKDEIYPDKVGLGLYDFRDTPLQKSQFQERRGDREDGLESFIQIKNFRDGVVTHSKHPFVTK